MSRTSKADRLLAQATDAAAVRAHHVNPDVIALQVERVRAQVDRLMWTGIILGLAFTMTNVQDFAAGDAPKFTLTWWAAWLLDPMVSLVLIAVLRAEQITARHQITTGAWVRRAKWFTLAATYVMNTWDSWAAGSASGIVLHSVPPLVVFVAAEAVTDLRDKITETVHRAYAAAVPAVHEVLADAVHEHPTLPVHGRVHQAVDQAEQPFMNTPVEVPANIPVTVHEDTSQRVHETVAAPVHEVLEDTVHERPTRPARERRAASSKTAPKRSRKALADYVALAREHLTDGIVVTPAWVREVTECSRGLSPKVAAVLKAEVAA